MTSEPLRPQTPTHTLLYSSIYVVLMFCFFFCSCVSFLDLLLPLSVILWVSKGAHHTSPGVDSWKISFSGEVFWDANTKQVKESREL